MFPERQVFLAERLNQLGEIFNSLGTSDEELKPTWIANKIRFPILVDFFGGSFRQETGNVRSSILSKGRLWSGGVGASGNNTHIRAFKRV